ncbi:GntR family transcriptional regulator [Prosthecomicrobium sp. N25]|uniref:GntR family transcriptional regulator n=1 Tax=Prosthecomicrobium sp. N25 TaxID=3129254 RepID=UPI00307768EA
MDGTMSVRFSSMYDERQERKSDTCYRMIRTMIVDFKLLPGAFIDKVELCTLLKVSRQPVTSALSRLEREGLVEILPQRGSYVSRLSLGTLVETLLIRAALESYAAGRAAHERDPALIAELNDLTDAQAARHAAGDAIGCAKVDGQFHQRLAAAAGLPRLLEQVDIGLAAMARTTRAIQGQALTRDEVEDHRAICAALAAGDDAAARRLTLAHAEKYAGWIQDLAKQRPEIFVR